ncbi:MAG TPA: outer membrane beta-barrel protein [Hyphomonadaceae bacterium]|jgi:opacity protein-like surface antigen|nr:outer membrane beta-barrel protein [Hyphomonadaceae bacterium]
MKRMIGAAMLMAAVQGIVSTASADEHDQDRDRDRDRDRGGGRQEYFFAGGGSIGDHRIKYDIPGGQAQIQTENGDVWTAGYGHQFNGRIRGETTFSYSEQPIRSVRRTDGPVIQIYTPPGNVQVFTLAWMGYTDFNPRGTFRPYIGTGLGLSNVDLNDRVDSGAGIAVTGRAVAGIRFMISDNTALYAEARYDAHFKDAGDNLLYLGGQSAVAGLKVGF